MRAFKTLHRFGVDQKGLAAVEFAILLPMMVTLMFGSVEIINMLGANQRVQNVAASLADVVSRDTEISNAEITGIWTASDTLMFPEDAAPLQMRVSSISIIDATTARVMWSEGSGMSPRAANSIIALPAAMMNPGTSMILAETIYPYETLLGIITPSAVTMTHQAYRRSRLIDPIPRVA